MGRAARLAHVVEIHARGVGRSSRAAAAGQRPARASRAADWHVSRADGFPDRVILSRTTAGSRCPMHTEAGDAWAPEGTTSATRRRTRRQSAALVCLLILVAAFDVYHLGHVLRYYQGDAG